MALLAAVGFTALTPLTPASAYESAPFEMRNQGSGMCLDVPGGTGVWGTQLIQWPCNGGDNQKFTFYYIDNIPVLRNKATGLCVDVPGGSGANGTAVVQWGCNAGDNQRWFLSGPQNSVYHNTASRKCLEVADWRTDAGAPVRQWDCHSGASQQWVS
ncbi:RICIN domain-containing protein [Streptomyces sp. NPDC056501]|uniref:RICIN domain-containing protein n=1 Tax=unclassified Streptomyces TaxID=2593676 RepID=UPI0036995357